MVQNVKEITTHKLLFQLNHIEHKKTTVFIFSKKILKAAQSTRSRVDRRWVNTKKAVLTRH